MAGRGGSGTGSLTRSHPSLLPHPRARGAGPELLSQVAAGRRPPFPGPLACPRRSAAASPRLSGPRASEGGCV